MSKKKPAPPKIRLPDQAAPPVRTLAELAKNPDQLPTLADLAAAANSKTAANPGVCSRCGCNGPHRPDGTCRNCGLRLRS